MPALGDRSRRLAGQKLMLINTSAPAPGYIAARARPHGDAPSAI